MTRILACGAHLKNTACLFDTNLPGTPVWSVEHGDLSDPSACMALEHSARALLTQAGGKIDAIAHDLHPDFYSTRLAQQLAHELQVSAIAVQHHQAHMACVMAEHALLDTPVIGIALDGVGFGSDGTAWGGEVLWLQGEHFERMAHLLPLALAGGDVAAREPWRMAASALHILGLADQIVPRLGHEVGEQQARIIKSMLERSFNSPTSSAAGRWFDAVAGLLGLSVRQSSEAQAAIALENAAARHLASHKVEVMPTHWHVTNTGQIDLRPLLRSILVDTDVDKQQTVDAAAARFHLTLAAALAQHAARIAHKLGVCDIVFGGGCFFNRILKQAIVTQLEDFGLTVWSLQTMSCGDASLALGQAWVAAQQLSRMSPILQLQKEIPCV